MAVGIGFLLLFYSGIFLTIFPVFQSWPHIQHQMDKTIPEAASPTERSFTIDYDKNTFLKDGKSFRYVSGSIHYSRIPRYYWEDRLKKMYAAGLDAIQIYIPWNFHEPEPGVYRWDGEHDVVGFIKEAQQAGLLVILRPGPYICAEWEFGGFPYWLLKTNKTVKVRTMDPAYIEPVNRWMGEFLSKMKPLLYANGGPIIMAQVENEYGSYSICDKEYLVHLRDVFRKHLGPDVVLFTADEAQVLTRGKIDGVYATVNFGPADNLTENFLEQRKIEPKGPLVNSEYYVGWLDYWGHPHQIRSISIVIPPMDQMLSMGANVNMYMFEGGTNFGFWSGADPPFRVCPTTYDYDAPLSEAGDITPKYMAIRKLIDKFKPVPDVPIPVSTPKYAYGRVDMKLVGTVYDLLKQDHTIKPVYSKFPLTMEELNQCSGFVLYRHKLKKDYPVSVLSVFGVRDMAYVMQDGVFVGILDRNGATEMNFVGQENRTLDIFVENQGRISFGADIMQNRKGLISKVMLGTDALEDWQMYKLGDLQPSKVLPHLDFGTFSEPSNSLLGTPPPPVVTTAPVITPAIYTGSFQAPNQPGFPQDTFFSMDKWGKGHAFINDFNIGRYWPTKGPQVTLYVPASVLKPYPQVNTVAMVELQWSPRNVDVKQGFVTFVDEPNIDAPPGMETKKVPTGKS